MTTGGGSAAGPPAVGGGRPERTIPALVALLVGLAAYDVVRHLAVPGGWDLLANLVAAVAVGGLGWWAALSTAEVGTDREDLGAGLRWGGIAGGAVLAVVAVAAAVALAAPSVDGAFDDDRAEIGAGALALEVLVVIPLGTVVLEELAFRGVLLGLARRRWGDRAAVGLASLAFGLWHVPVAIGTAGSNEASADAGTALTVAATVAATAVAGVVLCWLRLRSRSLVAPALAHWAVNGGALVAAWVVVR